VSRVSRRLALFGADAQTGLSHRLSGHTATYPSSIEEEGRQSVTLLNVEGGTQDYFRGLTNL
jgi:hypothetical protein